MSLLLKNLPVSVEEVAISGNKRTKKSYIEAELLESINSKTVQELHSNLEIVAARLQLLGVYDSVDINLEVVNSTPERYATKVKVQLKEKGIPFCKMETFLRKGTVIKDIGCELQSAIRNPYGYGESTKLSFTTSSSGSNELLLHAHTPIISSLRNSLDIKMKCAEENLSSYTSFKQDLKSVKVRSFSRDRRHSLSYEFAVRDEIPLSHPTVTGYRDASSPLLSSLLSSTKSSLSYSYSLASDFPLSLSLSPNRRVITPEVFKGSNAEVKVELALPPGTCSFFKTELQGHSHIPLSPPHHTQQGLVLSLGFGLGALLPLSLSSPSVSPALSLSTKETPDFTDPPPLSLSLLSDRFYAGGPSSIRGFSPYGVGPRALSRTGGIIHGDALGGEVKLTSLSMLSVPLPLPPPFFQHGARALCFLNSCSLSPSLPAWSLLDEWKNTRCSLGVGLSLPIGRAIRADLTYSVPIKKTIYDELMCFQLGVTFESCFSGKV